MRPFLPTLALSLMLGLAATASPPPATQILVRIGLCKTFGHTPAVLLSCDGPFTIQDALTGRALLHGSAGTSYQISAAPNGLTLLRAEASAGDGAMDQATPINVVTGTGNPLKIALPGAKTWHHYRGTFTLKPEPDGTLRVINTVPLEQYLYGVIPAEIGANVPPEAMKAQAVAARTYALKNRGRFAADGFDMDDTTRCEGYFGLDGETRESDAAVDATRGLVLTWQGALIDAPYSTDSGGMTACDPTCPYLQAVRDAPGRNAPDYAADGKYHTWTLTDTPAQLQTALARDPRTRVTALLSLQLDGFDASGRITTATVTGTDGTSLTVTGPQLRQILGYDVLRSTLVTLAVLPDGDYQFTGRGWGHGLGMSQEGAVAMASPPYRKDYKAILSHYYVGTALTPSQDVLPITLAVASLRPGP